MVVKEKVKSNVYKLNVQAKPNKFQASEKPMKIRKNSPVVVKLIKNLKADELKNGEKNSEIKNKPREDKLKIEEKKSSDELMVTEQQKRNSNHSASEKTFKNKLADKKSTFKKNKNEGVNKKSNNNDNQDVGKAKLDTGNFKDRKLIRRMNKNKLFQTGLQSKQLWEEMRKSDIDASRRKDIGEELFKLVKGNATSLVFAHDTSRVVQTLIKYGTRKQRDEIFQEIKDRIVEMCKVKFAKFCIRKFMKYGTKEHRNQIFASLQGNLKKLIRHKEASDIVEYAFSDFASAKQREAMVEEFYGAAFHLNKTSEDVNLATFLKRHPDKKDSVLSELKEKLASFLNKNIMQLTFVHRLLFEFFQFAEKSSKSEMIESLRESIVHMLHTKHGSKVAMACLWHGTTKDRKVIIKSFKTFVVKICKEEFGHSVLLALFDCVDDTKLVQKAILDEMLKEVQDVAKDQYGKKVLFYLVATRHPRHFHPDILSLLSQGDGNEYSKKDKTTRSGELLSYVSTFLIKWIADNAELIVKDNSQMLLALTIFTNAIGDPTNGMQAICRLVGNSSNQSFQFVDSAAGHLLLKNLILNDAQLMKKGEKVLFSNILLDSVPEQYLQEWIKSNRGCFTLASLFEIENEEIGSRTKMILSGKKNELKSSTSKGSEILLSKLKQT